MLHFCVSGSWCIGVLLYLCSQVPSIQKILHCLRAEVVASVHDTFVVFCDHFGWWNYGFIGAEENEIYCFLWSCTIGLILKRLYNGKLITCMAPLPAVGRQSETACVIFMLAGNN